MKKRNLLQLLFAFAVFGIVFSSCKKDDVEPEDENVEYHELGGFYIANEGFQNGSISFYDSVKDVVVNNVFQKANGMRALGKYVQSLTIVGNKAVICVNGGNNVVITEAANMKQVAEITISSPRYAVEINDSIAFVSSWSNKVFVINVNQGKVVKEIAVGSSPDRMIKVGDKVFVANSGYAKGADMSKTISVISIASQTVVKTIESDFYSPFGFVKESDDYLWVLFLGKDYYNGNHEPSALAKIDIAAGTIVKTVNLYADKHPSRIAIDKDKSNIYIGCGWGFPGIVRMPLNTQVVEEKPFIEGSFYGLDVNPATGNIIVFTVDYSASNKMFRYKTDGTEINNYEVGVLGNGAAFKKRSN
ncbi:MAG: hypothetical protein JXA53_11285 [Bacteroidales bacterium]|nr:hypothetical protein [Bacteroidales bacterium]